MGKNQKKLCDNRKLNDKMPGDFSPGICFKLWQAILVSYSKEQSQRLSVSLFRRFVDTGNCIQDAGIANIG